MVGSIAEGGDMKVKHSSTSVKGRKVPVGKPSLER